MLRGFDFRFLFLYQDAFELEKDVGPPAELGFGKLAAFDGFVLVRENDVEMEHRIDDRRDQQLQPAVRMGGTRTSSKRMAISRRPRSWIAASRLVTWT